MDHLLKHKKLTRSKILNKFRVIWTNNVVASSNLIFFFFEREFQPMASAPNNSSLLLDQDINQFRFKWRLNPRSLIQLSETLLVELTETHNHNKILSRKKKKKLNTVLFYLIKLSISYKE